ncbi:MAG TPA: glycosyltransferase family 39 protein, partial [Bacteroidia bacterium]|nr:glycosyltransferase family 39 protein [Bacteroidia bacterium]
CMAFLYGYHDILFMRPWSLHQWRQSDCLSITYNFYKEGMHFFNPAVNWCGVEGTGKACTSECPWLYYLVACLWQIFGYHEWIYRMVDTLIAFSGLYFLFKLTKEILQDGTWSILVSLLLFTSPIFAYYANNFTTDVPSLSLALVAWYFFYKFYKEGNNKHFYKWLFFCLLAGLTKISALLSFVPVFIILPLEAFGLYQFKPEGKIFAKPMFQISSLIVFIAIIAGWTWYAISYNNTHFSAIFSTQTYPIWSCSPKEIKDVLRALFSTQLSYFMSASVFLFVLFLFFSIILVRKQVNKLLFIICCSVFAGCVVYVLLWFRVLDVHDYYLINLLVFIPCVLITFLHFLKKNHPAIFQSKALKLLAIVVFACNIYYCNSYMHARYFPESRMARSFVLDKAEIDNWSFYNKGYNAHFKALETITPYLRSIGLKREDKVVSLPDPSIDISLYLMDQKGYTEYYITDVWPKEVVQKLTDDALYPFGIGDKDQRKRMKKFIESGAKYLVLNDSALLDSVWMRPFAAKKIGEYKNVKIYDLNYHWTLNDTINLLIRDMRHTPEWFKYIAKDAQDKGIPLDTSLRRNAVWIVQHKQFKL